MIFDKTGTLTYGEPRLTDAPSSRPLRRRRRPAPGATVERYSKHPELALRRLQRRGRTRHRSGEAADISERAGDGLRGTVAGRRLRVTSRKILTAVQSPDLARLPPAEPGMECVIFVDELLRGDAPISRRAASRRCPSSSISGRSTSFAS